MRGETDANACGTVRGGMGERLPLDPRAPGAASDQ